MNIKMLEDWEDWAQGMDQRKMERAGSMSLVQNKAVVIRAPLCESSILVPRRRHWSQDKQHDAKSLSLIFFAY